MIIELMLGAAAAICLGFSLSLAPGGHVFFDNCRVDLTSLDASIWSLMNIGTLLTPFMSFYTLSVIASTANRHSLSKNAAADTSTRLPLHLWFLPGSLGFVMMPFFLSDIKRIAPVLLFLYLLNGLLLSVAAYELCSARHESFYGRPIILVTKALLWFWFGMALLAARAIAFIMFE
jgi:hypothetical protein